MTDAAKDHLAPKRFGIVAYVCVIVHFLCGSALTGVTAALRASENGKFSCSVGGQSTATYKKQVEQACFLRYDEAYNSPIPLYGFVLLSIGSTVLISVIYSLVVRKRVDEIESNNKRQADSEAEDQTQNRKTIYVFYSYFVHLVLRALFGIIFTILQHVYFYPNGFDSKFTCNLRPKDDVTPNEINPSKIGSRNSKSFTGQNATASEKMISGIIVSILNCIVATIILAEVVYLVRRFSILKCHSEERWNLDSEFVTVYLLYKQNDVPERLPLTSTEKFPSNNSKKLIDADWTDSRMESMDESSGGIAPNIVKKCCEKKSLTIGNMNSDVFLKACTLLNIKGAPGRNWRALAGKLGCNVIQVKVFEGESNPAETMLFDWHCKNANNNLKELVKALKKIENHEVIKLFEEELNKKGASCPCQDCSY